MNNSQPVTLKEIRTHGTKLFPFAIYHTYFTRKGTFIMPHWHDEVEILYFSKGNFQLEINMEKFQVNSESIYFINPGELHSITMETDDCYEDAMVFSPEILNFDSYDTVQIQLIRPIQKGCMAFPRCIFPDHPAFTAIRNTFMDIINSFEYILSKEFFLSNSAIADNLTAQLYIKSYLMRIFAILSSYKLFTSTEKNSDKHIEDIKMVLAYIKDNYREKIYISDLAEQVSLNEQYFCRFFKKVMGRSPIEYVNEYRIKQSLRLLEDTNLSVVEVCLECGYNNLGNFLREFKKHTGTTPLQYRKKKS